MARKKAEKNPTRRARLIQIMNETGVSQNELSRRTGIAQQNISKMCSERDYLNLSESNAEAITRAFPEYRIQWLLGYDDFKTNAEMVMSFVSEAKELRAKEQALFAVLSEMNGWQVCDCVLSCEMQGLPVLGDDFDCYAKISDGETVISFNKSQFSDMVNKIADYFAFELEHMPLENMEFN